MFNFKKPVEMNTTTIVAGIMNSTRVNENGDLEAVLTFCESSSIMQAAGKYLEMESYITKPIPEDGEECGTMYAFINQDETFELYRRIDRYIKTLESNMREAKRLEFQALEDVENERKKFIRDDRLKRFMQVHNIKNTVITEVTKYFTDDAFLNPKISWYINYTYDGIEVQDDYQRRLNSNDGNCHVIGVHTEEQSKEIQRISDIFGARKNLLYLIWKDCVDAESQNFLDVDDEADDDIRG